MPDSTCNIWRVKSVETRRPTLPADIRISLKKRGGPTHHIELVRQSVGRWCDGKYSAKLPEATANQIAEHIGRWLAENT